MDVNELAASAHSVLILEVILCALFDAMTVNDMSSVPSPMFISLFVGFMIGGVLMKVPNQFGRQMMDQVEGFKLYLMVTQKGRLNFHNPPELMPKVFEVYLPYAIVLDVENEWGQQLSEHWSAQKLLKRARAAMTTPDGISGA